MPAPSVVVIAAAIALVSPRMPAEQRTSLASSIRAEACPGGKCDVDPLFLVAFFWHESGFRAGAVGDHGRAIGLGQSWSWLYTSSCRADPDPLGSPGPACAAQRARLLDPNVNIQVTASAVRKAKSVCRTKVGAKSPESWLSLMGGRNHPRVKFRNVWCAHKRARGRWHKEPWRTDSRYREIREILDCQQNLTRKRPCRREDRAAPTPSRSTRPRSTAR